MAVGFFEDSPPFYPILNLPPPPLRKKDTEILRQRITMWEACGLGYYQLRAKAATEAEYLSLAAKLKEACPNMNILANDFASLAIAEPAVFSGLHLGQEDLAELKKTDRETMEALRELRHEARKKERSPFILGISSHNAKELGSALRIEDGIFWDYAANFTGSHIFAGHSKKRVGSLTNSSGYSPPIFAKYLTSKGAYFVW